MPQSYDMPLDKLREYRPSLTSQSDFTQFWDGSKVELDKIPSDVTLRSVDYPADGVKVFELTYAGFGGARIRGWYATPDQPGVHPGLVLFHGYNNMYDGGMHQVVDWAFRGYATFGMLVRGQQQSEDLSPSPYGHPVGWMAKGILDKDTYYYRGVYMDAIRAVEVLADLDEVDANRVAVTGASQGGGLALAAAALSNIPKTAIADYPYLCNFERAIAITPTGPYLELPQFFRRNSGDEIEQQALQTLSYFDVMNLAPEISCPTLVSIGLQDEITPPSTVFAAYNHIPAEKQIKVYKYFGHEYIPDFYTEKLRFLRNNL